MADKEFYVGFNVPEDVAEHFEKRGFFSDYTDRPGQRSYVLTDEQARQVIEYMKFLVDGEKAVHGTTEPYDSDFKAFGTTTDE